MKEFNEKLSVETSELSKASKNVSDLLEDELNAPVDKLEFDSSADSFLSSVSELKSSVI